MGRRCAPKGKPHGVALSSETADAAGMLTFRRDPEPEERSKTRIAHGHEVFSQPDGRGESAAGSACFPEIFG